VQVVTLSEFCRIVKKDSGVQRVKGKSSLAFMGEDHGRWVKLGSTIEESLGVEEATCTESVVRNWRDPTLHK
jgi:hypothetical protein